MKIYIAGPISGLDHREASENFEQAEKALAALGFEPVNPMKANGMDADGGLDADGRPYSWADYMKADIPLLLECEAVYLLRGWPHSRGASLEHEIASALGMAVVSQPLKEEVSA